MAEYKDVDKMSVRELKTELEAYETDYAAAVEKSDLKKLLQKTRKEKGWPPKPSSAKKATSSTSSAASSRSNSSSGRTASSGGGKVSGIRVAVLFDPDNADVRDCAQFIQPFFMNSPECSAGDGSIAVSWLMPASLRDELVRFNLPEQLANFDWFQALFVESDGAVTDFDGKLVDGLAADDNDVHDSSEPEITHFARVAERWNADWLMVRREGGVVGRRWLSSMAAALNAGYRAAYVSGILILDAKWHCEQVEAPIVPAALDPSGSWYYWLLECYNGLIRKLDAGDDADSDADKVMLACTDDALEPWRTEKFAPHKKQ